jgi:hypothetical protein
LLLKRDSSRNEGLRRRHQGHDPACKLGLAQRNPRSEERSYLGEDPVRLHTRAESSSATTRLALTFGSLVLLVVELIRNVRMVVHQLVASLWRHRDARIFVVRYPHRVSKSRESILSNEARLNDLRHLFIADFSSSTKSCT